MRFLSVAAVLLLVAPSVGGAQEQCELQGTPESSRAMELLQQANDPPSRSVGTQEEAYEKAWAAVRGAMETGTGEPPLQLYLVGAKALVGLDRFAGADSLLTQFENRASADCARVAEQTRYQAWVDLYNQAIRTYTDGDRARALELFEQANTIKADPRSLNNAAHLHEQRGDSAEARRLYEKALDVGGPKKQMQVARKALARLPDAGSGEDGGGAGAGTDETVDTRPPDREDGRAVLDMRVPETAMSRPDAIAVVVGIRDYEHEDVPDVDYALRDARVMKKYLTRTLGFREENVLFAENASGAELKHLFGTASAPEGRLHDYVQAGQSDVFVYYSGHGAPNPNTGRAYLVGADTDPAYLEITGYPVEQLYENLAKLPARSVTVVLEACFSGVSEAGAVVRGVSPATLSVENPVMAMEDGLAFTAGAADQVSSWYPEKGHGLFTYYFLKGLRGAADGNGDRAVTAGEMGAYLKDRVPYRARRLHSREQTPQVVGRDTGRVLVEYETPPPAEPDARAGGGGR